jgi:hypothetical protein
MLQMRVLDLESRLEVQREQRTTASRGTQRLQVTAPAISYWFYFRVHHLASNCKSSISISSYMLFYA